MSANSKPKTLKVKMGKACLVTGIAGSGKSTIKQSLADLGYTAYDIDEGMAHWVNRETQEPTAYNPALIPMTNAHDWLVNKPALLQAITSDEIVFICGAAHDLYRFCEYFDTVFLLQYPSAQAIKARLASRTNNSYGKDPKELADILGYWKDYEQKYIPIAYSIDCTEPPAHIISKITSAIGEI